MAAIIKGDFIELSYTGYVNGNVFDSNREEDMKKLDSEAKPRKMFIIVGQNMVVKGLDKALEGKEIGKEYDVSLAPGEAFGQRNPSLIRPLPLKSFTEKKVYPQAGMTLVLDNSLVSIRAVSGARVITDFNNPLAGKNIEYKFTINEKIDDISHKARIFFEWFLRGVPEFEVGEKIFVSGPEQLKQIVGLLAEKFKELVGMELAFKLAEPKSEEKTISSA